jgi:hypothetical protein
VVRNPASRTRRDPANPASKGSAVRTHAREEPRSPGEIPELVRLIHERMLLWIISALAVNYSLIFSDLKLLLRTTDGNLSVDARKLDEGGYFTCR